MSKMTTPGEWFPGIVDVETACETHGMVRKAVETRRLKVKDVAPGMRLVLYEVVILGTYEREVQAAEGSGGE